MDSVAASTGMRKVHLTKHSACLGEEAQQEEEDHQQQEEGERLEQSLLAFPWEAEASCLQF